MPDLPAASARVAGESAGSPRPLVVDLDGTLVRTDLLVESLFALLRRNPTYLLRLPLWLARGKAALKTEIARRVELDIGRLPYHQAFLRYLRDLHAAGTELVLATASSRLLADQVAAHLGIFAEVLATSDEANLKGAAKRDVLVGRYGTGGYDYAGNDLADIPVWEAAAGVVTVNPDPGAQRWAARRSGVACFEDRPPRRVSSYLRALRLYQWLKNLLVFVPLFMAHRFTEFGLLVDAGLGFVSFSLCASSVYLLNDLLDLPDDRKHPSKRSRPFAAGDISVVNGIVMIPALLAGALLLAMALPSAFLAWLALYYAVTLAYSFALKNSAMTDVLTLAGLYTTRILAGAAAVSVVTSFWLLAFSMFLFLSLALVKRYAELFTLQALGENEASGRGYITADLDTLSQFGTTSAYMAVLVLALYINSEDVTRLYDYPHLIWLLCPLVLYLVTRIWLLARRGLVNEDPLLFVIRDRRSQALVLVGGVLLWLAT